MSDQAPGAVLRGAVDLSSLRNRSNQPATSAAENSGAPSYIVDITDATFQQVLEISRGVPVVVDMWAGRSEASTELSAILDKVVTELAGRLLLAKVEIERNPQIAQAFRAQSVPLVVALINGQPVPLFSGATTEEQVRATFNQLFELATQQGVTQVLGGAKADDEEQTEPELPPLHQEAFVAIEAGDYAVAIEAYEKALAENPRDEEARAGLGQVKLLHRAQSLNLQEARAAAAANRLDVQAQLNIADLDLAGGHVDDAFGRLLDLFAELPADERTPVRERLLELFGLVGDADARVIRARSRLTSLLF
ncbi:tetratricopeptide repeat protein [Microbacterium sp. NC79]|uniref:tetratricopeptide repeat protein n=1 Tax=Microbacterium sp. NC79 TaxID=2851009 RepID=UPI001C2B9608|nr:tetratricopeptide repeat protein [Microbacterium sp. NC79]MBV0894705.1 tetratricopeptide repeat protein [Microbacterium sp. NC79]